MDQNLYELKKTQELIEIEKKGQRLEWEMEKQKQRKQKMNYKAHYSGFMAVLWWRSIKSRESRRDDDDDGDDRVEWFFRR